MEITSLNNERIKYYQKLKQKKYRDMEGLFLVEDEHLVNEAHKFGYLKEVITSDKSIKYDVPIIYVTDKIMKSLSEQVTSSKVIGVCKKIDKNAIEGNIIVLDNIQDPGNLGTIIRSAVAFNFKTIVMSKETVDIYNPKVIRATEGMLFNINIIKDDLKEFLENLDESYLKITTDVNGGEDIKKINFKDKRIALVIGNEGKGVSKEVANICDKKVYLKMNKACESLNAGVSASILMYEVSYE